MSVKIEEFIKNNLEAFNDQRPDRSIWLEIERNLDQNKGVQKNIVSLSFFKIAASIIFILGLGILLGNHFSASKGELNYALSLEMQQFKETEAYYQTEVLLKLNELKDPKIKTSVEVDLKQLDDIYHQLKTEMLHSDYINSSIMIDALIKNYKTKVEILENILNKQNQIKNETEVISL